eukprot:Nitzschia sp. Nitz4//scaffold150_size53981//44635//47148//NITZ4_006686-RA/size53981-processed-gene-0.37-mRNA-1//-1//CDS//3329537098//7996//frame0
MGRRGKKRTNSSDAAASAIQRRTPKITEQIADSDDEEIDEDEAFNSEDERMFGHFFTNKKGGSGDSDDDGSSGSDEDMGDDESGEEGEDGDDDDDGGDYMLQLLEKLESVNPQKNKGGAFSEPSSVAPLAKVSESEYSRSMGNQTTSSKAGVTLNDLMEGLEDTKGFKNLQTTFSKTTQATPAPLDRVVANRTQRKMAYEEAAKEISDWTQAVQENRQAETLDFKPKQRHIVTRDTLVANFEPTTDFERELQDALESAGQQDEEAILKAEEKALQDDLGANLLTMEEYKKRRGQLAQVRALMFYHEQKQHHIKKIKSKKYRRIRKKQRERQKESEMEAAVEEDDDLANELKEKEEVSRIQERMTLAHKNTSKWAKRILKRGKNVDVESRRALSAQLKRGDDLRRKMMGDESDASDDSEDLVESARRVLQDTDEANDPTQGQKGLFKLSFMQKGLEKQRERARDEARKLLEELEANEMESGEPDDENDTAEPLAPPKQTKMASDKEMKSVLQKGEMVATSLEFGNAKGISISGGIDIDVDGDIPSVPVKKASNATTVLDVSGKEPTTPKNEANSKKAKNAEKAPKEETTEAVEEEANPWMVSNEASKDEATPSRNKRKIKKGLVDVSEAAAMLDADNPKSESSATTEQVSNPSKQDASASDKKLSSMTQEELVRRAFASASDKEIEEEFAREKEELAAENDPTRKVQDEKNTKEVAGWGSWTGSGAPPPPPRRRPKGKVPMKKDDPNARKRKDDGKPHVIINQKRLKKTANTYMLGDVPHPFSSRAEYEASMMGGMGKEWNVTGSFKNMTRPEILTRSGKIIQPISKKAKVARAPAKF